MYERPGLLELESLADPVAAVHGKEHRHAVVAGGQQAVGADPCHLKTGQLDPGASSYREEGQQVRF